METVARQKQAAYQKYFMAAGKLIQNGNVAQAAVQAKEGMELGIELGRSECAGQYLFCLNELGRFDEAVKAAKRCIPEDGVIDDTVLSNALCAILSFGREKAQTGLSLLKKSNMATVKEWRRRFERLDYSPSQLSLIFNTALILAYAGQAGEAHKLLKEIMEHLAFFINSTDFDVEVLQDFMLLVSETNEFKALTKENVWNELSEIAENSRGAV